MTQRSLVALALALALHPAILPQEPQVKPGQTISELLEPKTHPVQKAAGAWEGWTLVIGTAGLMALVCGALFLARRRALGLTKLSAENSLQIVGRAALSPKHVVFVLRVADRQVVVGLSGERMVPLAVLDGLPRDKDGAESGPQGRIAEPSTRTISASDLMPYRRQVERLRGLLRGKGSNASAEETA
jgi:flagellar biogenesis protein FliO